MYILISLMILLISTFIMLTHPLSMGLSLLISTILISLITGMMSFNYWFSYILFLIMIGGMLILFIYMTSIASNEKFSMTMKMTSLSFIIMMGTLTSLLLFNDKMLISPLNNENLMMLSLNKPFTLTLTKYLMYPQMMIFLSLILFLLITLIMTVKITESSKGPLRQNF